MRKGRDCETARHTGTGRLDLRPSPAQRYKYRGAVAGGQAHARRGRVRKQVLGLKWWRREVSRLSSAFQRRLPQLLEFPPGLAGHGGGACWRSRRKHGWRLLCWPGHRDRCRGELSRELLKLLRLLKLLPAPAQPKASVPSGRGRELPSEKTS